METPQTKYAKTPDGAYIAYQTVGDGPIDIVWQFDWLGNVDTIWEYRPSAEWFHGLASFSRLILHDRRGTGASSRNVDPPNLETRVADLTVVLDAVGSERPVLGGALEGGAPNILFAATFPERIHSLFWWYPAPRTTLAPDYPFGASEDLITRSTSATIDLWGTDAYGYSVWTGTQPETEHVSWGWLSRQTATPDVAVEMDRIYNDTDVRGVMPSIAAPVLLLARENDREALAYLATLLRQPQMRLFPGADELKVHEQPAVLDAIREFVGISRAAPELDTILSTVLFTDVIGSTQKQAELGDRRYKGLIEQHHEIVRDGPPTMARPRVFDRRRRLLRDRSMDPRGAIRCAMEIGRRVIDLGIEIRAGVHTGECESDRRRDQRSHGVDRGAGCSESRPLRGVVSQTVKDLVAGIGSRLRGRGRARAQRRPRPLAALPGDVMTQAPETRYARAADGIHVGYQVVGSGPVDLVFVPYDYSNIEAAWDFPPFVSFVRGLASIGRVLVFDRRGSGTSDRSWTGEAATIEAQMDDIRAVMDAASSERAFLFGIESGASLCFTFAATHPHRTSGVIVQAPMVRGTPAPDYPATWSREMYEEYFERVEHAWGTDAFVREVVEMLSPSLLHDETTRAGVREAAPALRQPGRRDRPRPGGDGDRRPSHPPLRPGPDARPASDGRRVHEGRRGTVDRGAYPRRAHGGTAGRRPRVPARRSGPPHRGVRRVAPRRAGGLRPRARDGAVHGRGQLHRAGGRVR